MDGLEHGREGPLGIDVARGRQSDAAGHGAGLVGEDVAEEVVGDDDVEAAGVGHHVDGGGVHVAVVDGDLGVLGADGLHGAPPQVAGVDEHVVLVDEGEVLGRPGLGLGEGVADQALHPVGRVDADLGGDLVRRALAHDAAVTAVEALGALAHHDEVDVAGIGQRRRHARVVHRGTQVDVVVQGEAQTQEQTALEHTGGNGGIADSSQQNGVMGLDGLEILVGEGLAGAVPALGPQVEGGGTDRDPGSLQRSLEDLEPFGDDLLTDAVTRDYCQLDGLRHGATLGQDQDARQRVRMTDVRTRVSTVGRLVCFRHTKEEPCRASTAPPRNVARRFSTPPTPCSPPRAFNPRPWRTS